MVITVIKRMQSRDTDQTWKTDIHNKVTTIMQTKQQKQMSNSDYIKNWEHGPCAPVGKRPLLF